MKIIRENYLKDSTVTATNGDSATPPSNLFHKYLEKKFQATDNSSVVTVLFPEDREVSGIAYGFNNVITGSTYTLKDDFGATVGSGSLEFGNDVNMTFFDPVVCRSVEVSFLSDSVLVVGGLSVGPAISYEFIRANHIMSDELRSEEDKTEGGQNASREITSLVLWDVSIPQVSNDQRIEARDMVRAVGKHEPIYVDLYEDADIEPPLYCNIKNFGSYTRNPYDRTYDLSYLFEECR